MDPVISTHNFSLSNFSKDKHLPNDYWKESYLANERLKG